MDIPAVQPHVSADQVPLERLAGNTQLSETEKVQEVARQFEAVLLRRILSEARKSLHSSGLGENSFSLGIYHDLINRTLADSISRSGMPGLAHSLQYELTRQSNVSGDTPPDSQP